MPIIIKEEKNLTKKKLNCNKMSKMKSIFCHREYRQQQQNTLTSGFISLFIIVFFRFIFLKRIESERKEKNLNGK